MKILLLVSLLCVSSINFCMVANKQYLVQNREMVRELIQGKRSNFKGLKKNTDTVIEAYAESSLKKKTAKYDVFRNANMSAMVYSFLGGVFLQMYKNVVDANSKAHLYIDIATGFAGGICATHLYRHITTPVPTLQNVMNAKLLTLEKNKKAVEAK